MLILQHPHISRWASAAVPKFSAKAKQTQYTGERLKPTHAHTSACQRLTE